MRKKWKGIFLGIIMFIIGVLLLLEFLDVLPFTIFFSGWWTLIIIIPFVLAFLFDRQKVVYFFGALTGFLLLMACQGWITFFSVFQLLLAIAVIYLGMFLTIRSTIPKETVHGSKAKYQEIFGSLKEDVVGELAPEIEVSAIFGNVTLDFSKATMKKNVMIHTKTILGNIDLILPDGNKLELTRKNFLGGCDNRYESKAGTSTIHFVSKNILGETDIQ